MIGIALFAVGAVMVGSAMAGGIVMHTRPRVATGLILGGFVLAALSGAA